METIIIYIHGKGGSSKETSFYQSFLPYKVIGVDYDGTYPWIAKKDIFHVYRKYEEKYKIIIIANSVGAYFLMLSLDKMDTEQVFLISPMVDMEKMILEMMKSSSVSEEELEKEKIIKTNFDEPLSWEYLKFVRMHPLQFKNRIEVLYGDKDFLVDIHTMNDFILHHNAHLTIMKNGEHWFHEENQLEFLKNWLLKNIK